MSSLMIPRLTVSLALLLVAGSLLGQPAQGTEAGPSETAAPPSPSAQEGTATPGQPAPSESPEQARRRELTAEHGAEIADAMLAGTVVKEMTMEQVLFLRGAPTRKEVIPPDAELWHYAAGEVAFSGGKVSYVSLASKVEPLPGRPRSEGKRQGAEVRGDSGQPQSGQVTVPAITVGDSYVYESKDPEKPDSSLSTRRTVTSTKGKVILSSINLDNKSAKARNLHFDREWNLIGTRNADNSGLDYSPPLKYFDFPLFPGKTWRQVTTETNIKTGASRSHTISGTVGQWEDVSVPAGTFRAIKIELQTELFDPGTGERIAGSDTSWYAPEVRRSVKSLTTGKDGGRRVIQLVRYELGPKP